jgi:hypothetical protein
MVRREAHFLIVTGGIAGGFDANRPLTNASRYRLDQTADLGGP